MRTSSKGKDGRKPRSVFLEIGFWRKDGGAIHVTSHDPEIPFHVIVRKDPVKKSGHPYLYRELEKCLEMKGVES